MYKALFLRKYIGSRLQQARRICLPMLILTAVVLACAVDVQAALQYWDTSSSAGLQHGNGDWSTAAAYWSSAVGGSAVQSVWVNNNLAYFSGTNGSSLISLKSTVETAGMTFNGSNYTVKISDGGMVSSSSAVNMSGSQNRIELIGESSSATLHNTSSLIIGQATGGDNTFVINGASALATNTGYVYVGNTAVTRGNLLIVTNGGSLVNAALSYIGNASSSNRVEVTGGGVAWNLGNQGLTVGYNTGSTGNVLRIDGQGDAGGARVTNVTTLTVGSSSPGGQNELVITNGGQLYGNAMTLGSVSASNQATITGTGSLMQLNGNLFVGNSATIGNDNVLTIENGAVVTNATLVQVGTGAGAFQNRMVITNGGALFSSGASYVGYQASLNQAEITGGGAVWSLGNAGLTVGFSTGSTGNVLRIDGQGVAGGALVTNVTTLRVGSSSPGGQHELVITNGGTLFSTADSIIGNTSSSNRIEVTGAASVWNLGNANLTVGSSSIDNTLKIDQGGTVANIATLTVNATNSLEFLGGTLSASNLTCNNKLDLNIGDGTQAAELIIQSGTYVNNNARFLIQSNATVSGRGRLTGGSSGVEFAAGSTLRPGVPGNAGTTVATLQLGPSTWQGGMTLEMNVTNVAGTAGTDWDQVQILGNMNFITNGSKFKIKLDSAGETDGGFDPNVARIIPLVTYSNTTITQADIDLDMADFQIGGNWVVEVTAWGIQLNSPRQSFVYVSANGDNSDGDSWSNAYTDLQQALNNAQNLDTICLAGSQTFEGVPLGASPSNTVFLLANREGITLRGGYEADPLLLPENHPGSNNPDLWPTVLQRESGDARVLTINAVTNVLIESVIITGGSATNVNPYKGGGICLSGCRNVTFSKCDITGNTVKGVNAYGGGLYIFSGDATLVDSRLVGNSTAANGNYTGYGGGAAVANGGTLTILRSMVSDNLAYGTAAQAGGLHIAAGATLDIRESVISSNSNNPASGPGGGVLNAGNLWMQNCLVVSNQSTHSGGLMLDSGAATVVNCTIADNGSGAGSIGIRRSAGVVSVTNSIIWGHNTADLVGFPADGSGKLTNVWSSCFSNSPNVGFQGGMDIDPLFVDRTYYHLKSSEGYYSNGYFSAGSWATADVESPVIDQGDPDADYSRELIPNGDRINMGAYGGTEVASKTADVDVSKPTIENDGAVIWGHRTVKLRGTVTDTGGKPPEAWFLCWIADGPTTNLFSGGVISSGFEVEASGLTPGATYQYMAVASNSAGVATSTLVGSFTLHPVASDLYVATNGDNTAGTNWSTAYSDLQTAFDIAEEGDVIYAAGQTFASEGTPVRDYAFLWQNVTNVTLRGGYQAASDVGIPGTRNSAAWPTLIRRSGVNAVRVLTMSAISNALIESITITNGSATGSATVAKHGGGVFLNDCQTITFTNCDITGNTASLYGGGLYLVSGDATLVDSRLIGNSAGGGGGTSSGGGAHVASGGTLTILGSLVSANRSAGVQYFYPGVGGGVYAAVGATLDIRESVIRANSSSSGSTALGGNRGGGVGNDGRLWMQNCLVVSNWCYLTSSNSDGLVLSGGTATVVNCTVANNSTNVNGGIGIRYESGVASVTNSIIWGHGTADLAGFPTVGDRPQNVGYSLFGGFPAVDGVNGCLIADPLFDDQTYYHLQSKRGVYRGGYFSGGMGWENAASNSPGLDAGTNLSFIAWQSEPAPNGRLVNIGVYGGTTVASMSPASVGSVIMMR